MRPRNKTDARPWGEVGEQLLACFVVALLAGVSVGVALPAESPLGVAVDGALLGAEQVGVADGRQGDRGKVEALGELPLVVGETPQFFSVAGVHATQAAGDVEEEGAAQQHQSPELEGSPAPVGKRTGLRLAHLTF